MGLFRKGIKVKPVKPVQSVEPIKTFDMPPVCKHSWKDFNWYIEFNYHDSVFEYNIIEPYVCIYCGERKNVTLEHRRETEVPYTAIKKKLAELKAQYGNHLQPKAIVENDVHDFQMVDRQELYFYKMLHQPPTPSPFTKPTSK